MCRTARSKYIEIFRGENSKMKQSELSLIYSYIYNNRVRLKNEIREMQTNLRYREIDVIDCLELALAVERYNTFKETTNQIKSLLKMEV